MVSVAYSPLGHGWLGDIATIRLQVAIRRMISGEQVSLDSSNTGLCGI